jgi:hypothetical protein
MKKNLEIDSNNGFLNLNDLPHNCIFNKVLTGCGATTIALENDENYVIAVPTTELIVNKTGLDEAGSNGKIFGVFGYFCNCKEALAEYLQTDGTKKIMVTYDSLPKVAEMINPSDYRLLVDEYHQLLKAYGFRDKAINGVLKEFRKFKSFCFMSATPIEESFIPDSLANVDEVSAKWNNTDRLVVNLQECNKPYTYVSNIIGNFMKDGYITFGELKSYELFFFLNSVRDIKRILDTTELKPEDVKIVCADTPENRDKLIGYNIETSLSKNKPITFITSKSFEGVDYFSETGVCFVVSNTGTTTTLQDISTDIYQIAGRIRTATNPFRNFIIHIYNTSKNRFNLNYSYEDMEKRTNYKIPLIKDKIALLNKTTDKIEKDAILDTINTDYLDYDTDTDTYSLNDIKLKLELFNYRLQLKIYKEGIDIARLYCETGAITTGEPEINKFDEDVEKAKKKMNFKEAFIAYAEAKNNKFNMKNLDYLVNAQPLIVDAYNKLGEDRVRNLKYIKKAIKDALINLDDTITLNNKVGKILKLEKEFISSSVLKERIRKAYNELGITDTPKASSITKWYEADETKKKIDGKTVRGYNIIRPKLIFK